MNGIGRDPTIRGWGIDNLFCSMNRAAGHAKVGGWMGFRAMCMHWTCHALFDCSLVSSPRHVHLGPF